MFTCHIINEHKKCSVNNMKNITRSIHVLDYLALDSKKCPQTRQNIENSHTKQGSAKKKYIYIYARNKISNKRYFIKCELRSSILLIFVLLLNK